MLLILYAMGIFPILDKMFIGWWFPIWDIKFDMMKMCISTLYILAFLPCRYGNTGICGNGGMSYQTPFSTILNRTSLMYGHEMEGRGGVRENWILPRRSGPPHSRRWSWMQPKMWRQQHDNSQIDRGFSYRHFDIFDLTVSVWVDHIFLGKLHFSPNEKQILSEPWMRWINHIIETVAITFHVIICSGYQPPSFRVYSRTVPEISVLPLLPIRATMTLLITQFQQHLKWPIQNLSIYTIVCYINVQYTDVTSTNIRTLISNTLTPPKPFNTQ